jgi:hypothetical protein
MIDQLIENIIINEKLQHFNNLKNDQDVFF